MARYLVLMLILGLTPALAQVPVVEIRPLADVLVDILAGRRRLKCCRSMTV